MALVKPIVLSVSAFDKANTTTIYFNVVGGDQVVKNEIEIINNNTSSIVYTNIAETYQYNQVILANTLTNGVYYAVRFRTYNEANNVSDWSEYEDFYCYTTPTLSLNISNGDVVNNSNFITVLSYNQIEGELINYGKIELYDNNELLIKSSDILTNSNIPPINLSYLFTGLLDNTNYKMKGFVETIEGTQIYTEFISFSVIYKLPEIYSSLNLSSYNCDGYISVESDIVSINGLSNPSTPIYIDDDKLDMGSCCHDFTNEVNSYYTKWTSGYSIPTSFILRYWFTPATINNTILKLTNQDLTEVIEVKMMRSSTYDYAQLTTTEGTIITSNGISYTNGTDLIMLWVKVINGDWTISLETLSRDITEIVWNGSSNLSYNYTTDITYTGESGGSYVVPTQNEVALIKNTTNLKIGNSMAYYINITNNIDTSYSLLYPSWDINTILDCNFNNNINGGNINLTLSQITGLRLKRKNTTSLNNWVTIYEKEVVIASDLLLEFKDYFIPSNVEQTYAIVPILQGNIEGDYIVANINPSWDGVFISDGESNFKLYNGVIYDSTTQNIPIGVLTPIGATYPIVLQNSNNNYKSGGLQAQLLGYDFNEDKTINRLDVVNQVNDFMSFMTNGKSKVLIDWNGNSVMFRVMGSPTISYNNSFGNGVVNVAFTWVEQGKYDNSDDLVENGFVNPI